MREILGRYSFRCTSLGLLVLLGTVPAFADGPNGDADLVAQVLTRLRIDADRLKEMTWVETSVLEKRDTAGAVRSRTVEAEEIYYEGGSRLKRQLSADLLEDSNSLAVVRKEESRILHQGRGREVKANPFELGNLIRCFRFNPVGPDLLDDVSALKIAFEPVDGCFEVSSRAARILQHIAGLMWVEERSGEILRVEGQIEEPVSFGFGILGRVDSFQIEVDREAVTPDIWAIVRTDYRARGRSFIFNRFDIRSTRYRSAFAHDPPSFAEIDRHQENIEGSSHSVSGAPSVQR